MMTNGHWWPWFHLFDDHSATVWCHVVSFFHLFLHALSLNQQPATWQINVHKVVESWAEGFSNLSFARLFPADDADG